MGLGRFGGGTDAARFLAAGGARVIVTDAAPADRLVESVRELAGLDSIELHLGGHRMEDFNRADLVVVNPAVPDQNPFLAAARQRGCPAVTAVNLFLQACPATVVGITGSNGKSTTAALTAHLLQAAEGRPPVQYRRAWLSGNIGHVPLLGLLDQTEPEDVVVLELSSFQIERFVHIERGPRIAMLTNLTPNHLDRHGTFEAYCQAKENLFKVQPLDPSDPALSLFFAEDPVGRQWFDRYSSQPGRVCRVFSPDDVPSPLRQAFHLPGRANLCNLAAAYAVVRHLGVTDAQIEQALPGFRSLPHRLEWIADIRGVRYYNDSIATTPESAIVALTAFDEPKVIIAGGSDKGVPFDAFGRTVATRAKAAVLVGATAGKIAEAIRACPDNQARILEARTFAQAVELASRAADPGDIVLLSPACASFDLFNNFQERGLEFARLVRELNR